MLKASSAIISGCRKKNGQIPVKGNIRGSRPRWYFYCIAAICIAAIIAVTSTSAVSNAASGQTSQVFATEPTNALSAGLVSNDAVITAPEAVLPGHVYVLNNREIVTEKPSSELDRLHDIAEEPSSHSKTTPHCATIRASVTVMSSRLIVVDENDTIIEVWSNTTGTKRFFYSLRVKEQSWQGPEHPLTQGILAQYNRLLDELDWNNKGRVY